MRWILLCAFWALGLISFDFGVFGEEPKAVEASVKVEDLIRMLGSEEFAIRNRACEALEAKGIEAVEALLKAKEQSTDAEIRETVSQILGKVCGSIQAGLVVSLTVDKQKVSLDQPLTFTVTLLNLNKEPITLVMDTCTPASRICHLTGQGKDRLAHWPHNSGMMVACELSIPRWIHLETLPPRRAVSYTHSGTYYGYYIQQGDQGLFDGKTVTHPNLSIGNSREFLVNPSDKLRFACTIEVREEDLKSAARDEPKTFPPTPSGAYWTGSVLSNEVEVEFESVGKEAKK